MAELERMGPFDGVESTPRIRDAVAGLREQVDTTMTGRPAVPRVPPAYLEPARWDDTVLRGYKFEIVSPRVLNHAVERLIHDPTITTNPLTPFLISGKVRSTTDIEYAFNLTSIHRALKSERPQPPRSHLSDRSSARAVAPIPKTTRPAQPPFAPLAVRRR